MIQSKESLPTVVPRESKTATDSAGAEVVSAAGRDLPDLVPVRMLNEFAYCARLSYFEWVQGEWADNLYTLEGSFGHRRVDKPDRANVAAAESEAEGGPQTDGEDSSQVSLHARSILLSAPQAGLIAKLDLLELDGRVATPVDYKRGQVPSVPGGAYEPERVQLCAQAIVLRENGFQCDTGVLYFIGSKRRVTVAIDDELIGRTLELLEQMRATAAAGVIPPPLVDSVKCPRCSLVGICLPDEVNWLRRHNEPPGQEFGESAIADEPQADQPPPESARVSESRGRPRKLLPARDCAVPLYVQEQGAMVGKSGDRLVIKKKKEVLAERRLMDTSQVCLYGNVMFSAQALREITMRGIPVCHFSYGGWFHSLTTGLLHRNVELRIEQFRTAADADQSLQFARQFVLGKVKNCRTLLRRHLGESEQPRLEELAEYVRRIERVDNVGSLLGLEGMSAKTYFGGFFQLLAGRPEFDISQRNRRPPRDPVNAVLSFVYSLLAKELTVILQSVGFDPMLGFLHRPRYGRPSLALDLCEEFRPLIADSVVLTVFNNAEVSRESFLERAGAVAMTAAGRRAVIAAFERRMDSLITHPMFGYRISYRRILEVQARLLARTLMREIDRYPIFTTR